MWGGARAALESLGHDVVWTGDWERDPGDVEILAKAHAERRVLVTLDKDFGEHAIVYRTPHSGILRLSGFAARTQGGHLRRGARSAWQRFAAGRYSHGGARPYTNPSTGADLTVQDSTTIAEPRV